MSLNSAKIVHVTVTLDNGSEFRVFPAENLVEITRFLPNRVRQFATVDLREFMEIIAELRR